MANDINSYISNLLIAIIPIIKTTFSQKPKKSQPVSLLADSK